jgi:hypothetical protein
MTLRTWGWYRVWWILLAVAACRKKPDVAPQISCGVGTVRCGPSSPGAAALHGIDPGSAISPLEFPTCATVAAAPPDRWTRSTRREAAQLADSETALVVHVRQALDTPIRAIARVPGATQPGLGAAADDSGSARFVLPVGTSELEIISIGYQRRRVTLSLRQGYTDTLSVGMQKMCTRQEPAPSRQSRAEPNSSWSR